MEMSCDIEIPKRSLLVGGCEDLGRMIRWYHLSSCHWFHHVALCGVIRCVGLLLDLRLDAAP